MRKCFGIASAATLLTSCTGDVGVEGEKEMLSTLGEQPAQFWEVLTDPVLDIGTAPSGPAYELYEIAGVRQVGNEIVVLTTNELRYYTIQGQFLRTGAVEGRAPHELGGAQALRIAADTAFVFDSDPPSVKSFVQGRHVGTLRLQGSFRVPRLGGIFQDGSILILNDEFRAIRHGFDTIWTRLQRFDRHGRAMDTLASIPFGVMGVIGSAGEIGNPLFGPMTSVADDAGGYWVAKGSEPEVVYYDRTGHLARVVRWHQPKEKVPEEAAQAHRDKLLSDVPPDERAALSHFLSGVPVAAEYAAVRGIVAVTDGHLWVDATRPYLDMPGSRWLVFDSVGQLVARVRMPERFMLHEAGTDHVIGVFVDHDGVESVRKYSLVKSQG